MSRLRSATSTARRSREPSSCDTHASATRPNLGALKVSSDNWAFCNRSAARGGPLRSYRTPIIKRLRSRSGPCRIDQLCLRRFVAASRLSQGLFPRPGPSLRESLRSRVAHGPSQLRGSSPCASPPFATGKEVLRTCRPAIFNALRNQNAALVINENGRRFAATLNVDQEKKLQPNAYPRYFPPQLTARHPGFGFLRVSLPRSRHPITAEKNDGYLT